MRETHGQSSARPRNAATATARGPPAAGLPAAFTLRSAAKQIAGARNAPAALDRNEALDGALGLVKLALYQLGSAKGAEGEVTSTEGEPA